jgi:uncharacterized protein
MATSTYKHGVTWRDVPTSIKSPVTADSGIPVAIGAAPVYLSTSDMPAMPNVPRVYYTYEEAVAEMGYSNDWVSYGLCEVMYNYFVLFNTGPIILINVFDVSDSDNYTMDAAVQCDVIKGQVLIANHPNIMATCAVADTTGTTYYQGGVDFNASVIGENYDTLSIVIIPGGAIPSNTTKLQVETYTAKPENVDKAMIIGGVDPTTGKGTGLEALDDVFPAHAIVPGIILCPGYSQIPEVAAVMAAKGDNINGCFRCIAYADVDSTTVVKAQDVNAWKNTNNYVSNRLGVFWPRVAIDGTYSWLSTQAAALTEWVDHSNDDIPVESPSNKNLKMNRIVAGPLAAPIDAFFGKSSADMLNGQGVVTAINWIGGWKLWGNNMSIYPSSSDVKDRWIPVRRMTDWVGNTIVLTVYQFVDKPGNRRLIDSIIDSLNIWLNSLVAAGNAWGARVEFRHDENPDTELLAGHYKFHVFEAFPTPAEWIEFLLEFDVTYLDALFTPVTTQTP